MAVTPLIIQAVYTAKYTARTRRCARSYTLVHGPYTTATRPYTCREHSRVHGRVHCRLRAVYTAITRPYTARTRRVRTVHMSARPCTYTARVHGCVCIRPVYTAVYMARKRPCTQTCTWPVHGLIPGAYTAVYMVVSRVHDPYRAVTRPCMC